MSIRRIPLPSRAMAVALLAVFLNLAGVTYAATGGTFMLGQVNTATTPSVLSASVAGRTLQLTNSSTAAGATPLGLTPGAGRPPFATASSTKVTNLNADKLDGLDSVALKTRVLYALTLAQQGFGGFRDSFTSHGGKVIFIISGSGYSMTANNRLSMCLGFIPAGPTAVCAWGFTNEANSHKTLVSGIQSYDLDAGTYSFGLGSPTATVSDSSDSFSILILEVPK